MPVMVRNIIGQALYQIIVMLTLMFFGPLMFDINYDYVNTTFYDDNISSYYKLQHFTLMF